MDRLPFTSSESEESDSTAQHRWESEGGNPGQLRQLLGNKKEKITTDGTRLGFGDRSFAQGKRYRSASCASRAHVPRNSWRRGTYVA
jgi:hypothetical protein